MKNKTFIKSVWCAIRGLGYALKTEKNYRYYILIYTLTLLVNIYFKVEFTCYIVQLLATMGVFASECLNTSIEHISDLITKELNYEIKIIKDIAAGSVLCWGIAYFTCEILFILKG